MVPVHFCEYPMGGTRAWDDLNNSYTRIFSIATNRVRYPLPYVLVAYACCLNSISFFCLRVKFHAIIGGIE